MHGAVCQSHDELGCVDCSGVVREKSLQSAISDSIKNQHREKADAQLKLTTLFIYLKCKKLLFKMIIN